MSMPLTFYWRPKPPQDGWRPIWGKTLKTIALKDDTSIKGFAIDLEGTTVDVERHHQEAHDEVARRVGTDVSRDSVRIKAASIPHYIGGPDRAVMEDLTRLSGFDGSMTVDEMLELDGQIYQEKLHSLDRIEPREGVVEVLTSLRRQGHKLAIGSLTPRKDAMYIVEKSGLLPLFDHIVVREDVKKPKPNPDVYLETARRMGIKPEEQVVFEDSHNGVIAADDAGVQHIIGLPVFDHDDLNDRLRNYGASHVITEGWRGLEAILPRREGVTRNAEGTITLPPIGDLGYNPGLNGFARR